MTKSVNRKFLRAVEILTEIPKAHRMRRPERTWDELFSFAQSFANGFLNPLQRRLEICGFLEELESMQPRLVMEIGTAQGGNFFLLSRASAPDAHIISLDLPGGQGGGGYPAWKVPIFRGLLLPRQSAVFLRGNSHSIETFQKVEERLRGQALDALFIDGDHSYAGAKQDFEMYSPLVRPGGVIAFHDIVPPRDHPEIEVSTLWSEIKGRYAHREFVEDWNQSAMGIGMVKC